MEFFEHDIQYRLVVVGDRVVGTEGRKAAAGDFRTNNWDSEELGKVAPPQQAVDMAVRAAKAVRLEFGGVDILADHNGRLKLTEMNFPCYFADQQALTGVDIAGAMVEYLIEKAKRLGMEA